MGQTLGIDRRHGRLYELIHLRIPSSNRSTVETVASVTTSSPLVLWHSQLGHVSFDRLRSLVSNGQLGVLNDKIDCLSCQLAKQPTLRFNTSTSISHAPFDLIHFDIWGPSPNTTIGASKYFVIFVDDFTCFTWLFLMKYRS